MKLKKIIAAVAAAALAVSMTAINAFAATVEMNSDYPGAWAQSAAISKAEFEAVGGDVQVVINYEIKKPLAGERNYVAKPMNDDTTGWDQITDNLLSADAIAKQDGFFILPEAGTTLTFVVPESVWSAWGDNGLSFQINNVILKSADLSAATSTPAAVTRVEEGLTNDIIDGAVTVATLGGAAAPAADGDSAPAATGNTAAASVATVMAIAGAAAIASRKRK